MVVMPMNIIIYQKTGNIYQIIKRLKLIIIIIY